MDTENTENETTTEAPAVEPETNDDSSASDQSDLPTWARRELDKTRGEAANYRTKLRATETELDSRGTAMAELEAKVTALEADKQAAELAATRAQIAAKHALPEALARVLAGDDSEALEAHAFELARYVAPGPGDPRGGLDGGAGGADFDPVELARQVRASRY
ncbi:hypothetical protein [Salininema proteolyticum]|uniref:Scaffolding protein n=1 Tax=Salininema proteolyticum TaxID=1607685 RepID=A0ABV8TZN0_9ACTN